MPDISFSCLIALVRTSSTVSNGSVENTHLWMTVDPRGIRFSSQCDPGSETVTYVPCAEDGDSM